jgi:predicted MPP superfamily phosphohydrolase
MADPITRRAFVKGTVGAAVFTGIAGGAGYSYWESGDLLINEQTIPIQGLPEGFHGVRIAFLTDLHRGQLISNEYVDQAVERANSLQADLILLGGDYVDYDADLIVSVMERLGRLKAPLGVYAVLGNRDIRANRMLSSLELKRHGILEITNRGVWIESHGSRIYLAGFDDVTIGHPDIPAGLSGATTDATILALTHNPFLVDSIVDPRVKLILCGHTHGGQINLPVLGRPFIPQGCERYPIGLIQSPNAKVFVSAGIGVTYAPIRFRCPPEVSLLSLARA